MGHFITSQDGAIYSSTAWHRRGITDPNLGTMRPRQAFETAGILWEPVMSPLVAVGVGPLDGSDVAVAHEPGRLVDLDGSEIPNGVTVARAVRRSDTGAVLAVVGGTYEPLGPVALAELLEAADVRLCNAFTLRGGRDVVATVAGDPFELHTEAGRDTVQPFTTLADNLDGSRRFYALGVDFRPDCANMLARAIASGTVLLASRHTAKAMAQNVDRIRRTMQEAGADQSKRLQLAQRLAERHLTATERRAYWLKVWEASTGLKYTAAPVTDAERERALQAEALVAELQNHLDAGDMQRTGRGSAWAALQAVTRWTTHSRTVRRGQQGATVAEARLFSNLLGTSAAVAAKAETLAAALL